jgi:urea transporter
MFMVGCCIVFVLFQLLLYVGLREYAVRDYAIFVVLTTFVHVLRTGHLSWDFWPGAPASFPATSCSYSGWPWCFVDCA